MRASNHTMENRPATPEILDDVRMVTRAAEYLKNSITNLRKGNREGFTLYAADAIVNIIQLGDKYDVDLMSAVFLRIKQLDRLEKE